jgi:hypothetical protein
MFYTKDAGLSLTFSVLDDGALIRRTTLGVFNVAKTATKVTFDFAGHRAATNVASFGTKSFVFREDTYSSYGPIITVD